MDLQHVSVKHQTLDTHRRVGRVLLLELRLQLQNRCICKHSLDPALTEKEFTTATLTEENKTSVFGPVESVHLWKCRSFGLRMAMTYSAMLCVVWCGLLGTVLECASQPGCQQGKICDSRNTGTLAR